MRACYLTSMIPSKESNIFCFPLISLLVLQDIQSTNIKKFKKFKKSKNTAGPRLTFAS
jgi:hypothetical protein